jgi:hypothetical protein
MRRSMAGGVSDPARRGAARHGATQFDSRGFGKATRVQQCIRRDSVVLSTPPQLRAEREGEEERKVEAYKRWRYHAL